MKKSTLGFVFLVVSTILLLKLFKNRNKDVVENNRLHKHPLHYFLQLTNQERLAYNLPPNKYYEEKYLLEMNPHTGRTHPEETYKIQQKLKEQKKLYRRTPGDAIDNQWEERGPNNVGGRTRVVLFDPNDASQKRVFAGGVSGGLWVNDDITDANSSWTQVGIDDNLSVTCMAVDPNNTQIMYLGTGELYVPQQALGNGIWKSTDGGNTWTNVYRTRGTTSNGFVPGTYYITDIVVRDKDGDTNTTNDSEVFASIGASFYTSNPINTFVGINDYGIFKSTDEGNTWNQVTLDVNGNSIAPNDFEIGLDNTLWLATTRNVYGDGGGRIYSSSDGINFTLKHTIANGRRTEISLSKQNANTVYTLARLYNVNPSNQLIAPFVSILKTTDAFATPPTSLALPNDADNGIPANDFTRGQAFYDLMIESHPTNDATVYVGGIDLFETIDSGANWTQISKWSNNNNLAALDVSLVHSDQHTMVFHPTNNDVAIFGNDGGVYYSSNLSDVSTDISINSRNKDYNTAQFYNGSISQTEAPTYFLAGSQDNGSHLLNNPSSGINSSTKVLGGDGGQCYIDKDNSYMIVTTTFNRIRRFDLPYTGNSITIVSDGTTGSFINAMALDDNLDILYTNGSSHLARFTDITTSSPLRTNITDALLNDITAIKVSPFTTTSSKVFAGTRRGKLVKIENAETENQLITDISGANFLGSISSVEFGASESEIMVTFYNFGVENIWFTTDGGVTWQNKEGNFPDTTVRCILMNPLNSSEVIIGTELGVWSTQNFRDASPNWQHAYNGMSNVAVTSLSLRKVDNTVLATTFGRGMYTGKFKGNSLTIWTGNINSDWTNTGNWSNGLPTINTDVNIPNTSKNPILNSSVTVNNLSIEKDAELILNESSGLTIKDNLTNNGSLIINSTLLNSGSLIVEGSSTGNITYNRFVTDNWHLVNAPVTDQVYNDDWVSVNAIASGIVNPNLRGIATYSNSSGSWQYMTAGDSGVFKKGTGYSLLKTSSGNLSFTGQLVTTNTTKSVTKGTSNAFNLVGNTYTSYIPLNNGADAVNNFLDTNVNALSELTIWLWNGSSYTAVNHVTPSQFIAPGQSFFVHTKPEGGIISFTKEMQNHQNSSFLKNKELRPEIKVILRKGKEKKHTSIFYNDEATEDFDNGYDSSVYTGFSNNFEIYTTLINQEKEMHLAIQSIPKDASPVIPIGIIASANNEFKISIDAKNLDETYDVYLEDRDTGVFTLLNDDNAFYTFTTSTALNGSGRFFLHTTSQTLQTNKEKFLSKINIFLSDDKLKFLNLPEGKKSVKIFSILGKLVHKSNIETSNFIIIKNLVKGNYIVRLATEKGNISQKIVIE
ncbi:T9SS C-terminal target domain-containing protein [Polaribacter sp. WD7]|uniref:T9SS type A sorting domain-containing protein n=1 Tax=Polaribacter sp. WD7 TaxID=2269061 RepID=UPI000DF3F0B9|nr:T9SS type A sorting domain-containing protein [Polaribacter sp. WD7]RCS26286.1 T9SS C-terminal target domain-containing protein [Polaribacter sp. WD7]